METMKFKGTKGRWEVKKPNNPERLVIESGGVEIADCWGEIGPSFPLQKELNFNAKLIASAPDLLEALQFLCDDVESWSNLHESTKGKIKQAISKALD